MFYEGEVPDGFITYEAIGATAAQDLLSKAGIALAVSTVLILIYIIIRFTPTRRSRRCSRSFTTSSSCSRSP